MSARLNALQRLAREFAPYKLKITLVIVLGLVISAVQPVSVRLSQYILDELKLGLTPEFLRTVPLYLVGIFAVSGLAKYFHQTLRRFVTEKVILKLREELFRKYLYLPLSIID